MVGNIEKELESAAVGQVESGSSFEERQPELPGPRSCDFQLPLLPLPKDP